jgi:hypothetical protein
MLGNHPNATQSQFESFFVGGTASRTLQRGSLVGCNADMRRFVMLGTLHSVADVEFEKVDPVARREAPRCPKCGRFVGMMGWEAPRQARLISHGVSRSDVAFRSRSDFLVTERFVAAFAQLELTGIDSFDPVDTTGATFGMEWFFVQYEESRVRLDPSRSDVIGEPSGCTWCVYAGIDSVKHLAVQDIGAVVDIARLRTLPSLVVVTERFLSLADVVELSNAAFVPLDEFTDP